MHPSREIRRRGFAAVPPAQTRRCSHLARHLLVPLLLAPVPPLQAQFAAPAWSPQPIGGIPIVLAEHGSEAAPVPFAATVVGLAIFDIATAGGSARSHNERPGSEYRSPRTAFGLSLASTALPVALGVGAGLYASGEAAALLIGSGMVLGPSVGHWYSGRVGRGLLTAGLRAGLGIVAGMTALAAS